VEDEAFDAEVKISLLMEEGEPGERILELARSYEIDLLVVAHSSRPWISQLIGTSLMPVVIVK
jgi:nucleotide-binding universal stress UspA family protein